MKNRELQLFFQKIIAQKQQDALYRAEMLRPAGFLRTRFYGTMRGQIRAQDTSSSPLESLCRPLIGSRHSSASFPEQRAK